MVQWLIQTNASACTGCLRCALACSEKNTGRFNPFAAHISIEINDIENSISFDEGCTFCGVCVEQCLYGALSKTRREAAS